MYVRGQLAVGAAPVVAAGADVGLLVVVDHSDVPEERERRRVATPSKKLMHGSPNKTLNTTLRTCVLLSRQ